MYFYLAVWDHDDDLNQPGEMIYSMQGNKREYSNELNRFKTYAFDTTLVVDNFFYVGWIKTKDDIMNVGFDINNNNQGNTYYNLGQEWRNTSFSGSLMMRPVMGKKISWPSSVADHHMGTIEVYPNPASDYIHLNWTGGMQPERFNAEIYSLQGSLVYQQVINNTTIPVSTIKPGVYILKVTSDNSGTFTTRLLISE
jgi:hypothetical protein